MKINDVLLYESISKPMPLLVRQKTIDNIVNKIMTNDNFIYLFDYFVQYKAIKKDIDHKITPGYLEWFNKNKDLIYSKNTNISNIQDYRTNSIPLLSGKLRIPVRFGHSNKDKRILINISYSNNKDIAIHNPQNNFNMFFINIKHIFDSYVIEHKHYTKTSLMNFIKKRLDYTIGHELIHLFEFNVNPDYMDDYQDNKFEYSSEVEYNTLKHILIKNIDYTIKQYKDFIDKSLIYGFVVEQFLGINSDISDIIDKNDSNTYHDLLYHIHNVYDHGYINYYKNNSSNRDDHNYNEIVTTVTNFCKHKYKYD